MRTATRAATRELADRLGCPRWAYEADTVNSICHAAKVPARLAHFVCERVEKSGMRFDGFVTEWPSGSVEASDGTWSLHYTDHVGEDPETGLDLYAAIVLYGGAA